MTMARVRNIPSSELPSDLAAIYERFAGAYDGQRLAAPKYRDSGAAGEPGRRGALQCQSAADLPRREPAMSATTQRYNVGGIYLQRPFKIRRLGHFGFNVEKLP